MIFGYYIRYDQEMFDFHHKIEALEEQWGREKQELAKVKLLIFFGKHNWQNF